MILRNFCSEMMRSWSTVPKTSLIEWRRTISCHSASVTKIHRQTYARVYPTVVVLPDGSSINIKYHEPRKIIKLPLDLSKLSDEERRQRMERRKPKQKFKIEEDIEDSFDASKYINLIKK